MATEQRTSESGFTLLELMISLTLLGVMLAMVYSVFATALAAVPRGENVAAQSARMDAAWGDHSWREMAYPKVRGLFGDMEKKTDNETIAEAFRARLHNTAGFEYVPEPIPMRNEQGAVVYYLYFASQNKTGAHIVGDIFKKYRNKGRR